MPCAFSLGVDEEDKATTLIQGTGFQTFFVGNDVAKALGYSDARKAIRVHVDTEDKGVDKMATPSGTPKTIFINESGLYSLVLSSKLSRT